MFKDTRMIDWQFILPSATIFIIFVLSDLFSAIDKIDFAYYSGMYWKEPYRIITAHFMHADFSHLLANIFGIVISRYFLNLLGLRDNYLFLILIITIMPLQSSMQWFIDYQIMRNPYSLGYGFSGVIYGVQSFILLSSLYGKDNFLCLNIKLQRNYRVRTTITLMIALGLTFSLLPGISLIGHSTGLIAGAILFMF